MEPWKQWEQQKGCLKEHLILFLHSVWVEMRESDYSVLVHWKLLETQSEQQKGYLKEHLTQYLTWLESW